jgi:hypothetical protein
VTITIIMITAKVKDAIAVDTMKRTAVAVAMMRTAVVPVAVADAQDALQNLSWKERM